MDATGFASRPIYRDTTVTFRDKIKSR